MAALSFLKQKNVKDISIRDVQNTILEANGYLLPYLDVEIGNVIFKPLQKIGATGILKGVGKNVDWSNQNNMFTQSKRQFLFFGRNMLYVNTLYLKNDNRIYFCLTVSKNVPFFFFFTI